VINVKELKEFLALMNEHELVEMELERDGMKIRLKKAGAEAVIERIAAAPVMAAPAAAPAATAPAAGPVPVKPAGTEIKSPMVGTFYRAPAPEAPPFVEVGQQVTVGQTLCIIEAMKLMNEFKAEVKGKIVKILVNNAQPIEFGQPLFIVEPN
jgi:acetyl-CoA carboxylase biotin carboxyl carrier protein